MKTKLSLCFILSICMYGLCSCSEQTTGPIQTDELYISQYDGVEIAYIDEPSEVTDDDVTEYIASIQEANPIRTEVDREAQNGDIVIIDYTGNMNGSSLENGSETDCELTIGDGYFIDGFEDSIIGHTPGESFVWHGVFPDDYTEELAGQDVDFVITLKQIIEEEMPELNDDFVQTVSDSSTTVDEYKEEVKKYLTEYNESEYTSEINSEAWDVVLENTTIYKYNEDEVAKLVNDYIDTYKAYADETGVSYEEFVQTYAGAESIDAFEETVQESVYEYEKELMATKAIAEAEDIDVTNDVYTAQTEQLALYYGYDDVDQFIEDMSEEDLNNLLLNYMVVNWVGEHSIMQDPIAIDDLTSSSSQDVSD